MISVSKKNVSLILRISVKVFIAWFFVFLSYKVYDYYKNYFEKERLEKELVLKKEKTNQLKTEIKLLEEKTKKVEESYINKEELEKKVKGIFGRMSVLDYNIRYLDAKKMCIDRHIIITQVIAPTEQSLKAAQGVISYLGEIKQSDKNKSIYFIDYISKPKDK